MVIVKCAWCGTVMETRGDQTKEVEETTTHSLCPICAINVQTEQTGFIIPIDSDPDSDQHKQ